MDQTLGFFARLWLAFVLPWVVLFDGRFAALVQALRNGAAEAPHDAGAPLKATVIEAMPVVTHDDPTTALQLLSLMQREGRFIDFLQEDVSSFADNEVGAAARVVHAGCKKALADYVKLEPIRREPEGAAVTLERGFDAGRTRLTGNITGEAPFKGKLTHHGWQVATIKLPTVTTGHDPKVIAPAEVEL
ncbi:MAG: DUF2760 domain-containing protein [Clostridia bacterium]|nr:DUF2760 domain-containing protein [Deltaproteobacteria bacterium]